LEFRILIRETKSIPETKCILSPRNCKQKLLFFIYAGRTVPPESCNKIWLGLITSYDYSFHFLCQVFTITIPIQQKLRQNHLSKTHFDFRIPFQFHKNTISPCNMTSTSNIIFSSVFYTFIKTTSFLVSRQHFEQFSIQQIKIHYR
jgi:hypothetical protein